MSRNGKQQFSSKDVIDLLVKAKELGVTELRLGGFETTFYPQEEAPTDAPGPADRPRGRRQREERAPACECGAPRTLGQFGYLPLCEDCFRSQPPPRRRYERPNYYSRPWGGRGRGGWQR